MPTKLKLKSPAFCRGIGKLERGIVMDKEWPVDQPLPSGATWVEVDEEGAELGAAATPKEYATFGELSSDEPTEDVQDVDKPIALSQLGKKGK